MTGAMGAPTSSSKTRAMGGAKRKAVMAGLVALTAVVARKLRRKRS